MLKLLVFASVLYLTGGCLITNCPKGGKRSTLGSSYHRFNVPVIKTDSSCKRCGPNHEGRCVGPSVCCGPKIGCLVGTPAILSQCSDQPQELPRSAKACSIGVCLSDAVCCSSDACKIDFACEMESSTDVCNLGEQSVY